MPIESWLLEGAPHKVKKCKHCGAEHPDFLRGLVQSSWRRFFGLAYCAVICHKCKKLTGWERPCWEKTPEGQKYVARFNEAVDTLAAERDGPNNELADDVVEAIRKAWLLGQDHCRQVLSDSYIQNKKAEETRKKLSNLLDETRDMVLRHTEGG